MAGRGLLAPLAVAAAFLLAGGRLFGLVDRHGVNLLFLDQWDYLTPLFDRPSWWEIFNYQHGPHRQGLGMVLSALLGGATGWNTRNESFAIALILAAAALSALLLKQRLFGGLAWPDALIPLICLSFTQIETAVVTPNPAHGAVPLLLVLLCGLSLTLRHAAARYLGLAALNFLALYTGFGFFMGLVTPAVLAYAVHLHAREGGWREALYAGLALALALTSLAAYFRGYKFAPAVACFQFPHPRPGEYLTFAGLTLTAFCGVTSASRALAKPFGYLLLGAFALALCRQVWRLAGRREFSAVEVTIAMFLGFTLLFVVGASVGRVCQGVDAGCTSRYVPLLIPGWLALYFSLLTVRPARLRVGGLAALLALCAMPQLFRYAAYDGAMSQYREAKLRWRACYLERESIAECDRLAGRPVHPDAARARLKEKLDFLKARRLNLYLGR